MTDVKTLVDLLGHQAWADAEYWGALLQHAAARTDEALRERLHHLHLVQHAFLALAEGRAPQLSAQADFADALALRDYARAAHAGYADLARGLDPQHVARRVDVPWFREPDLDLSVGELLLQVTLHSQHHRGQNAMRLRELGGIPPGTDLIVWFWHGRPEPRW
jgi:uncharacterized damage-inducible protein DinB